jgi:GDP-L-fucose synthase
VNLYGPRDNLDLRTSHVIPAMIRKFSSAYREGKNEVVSGRRLAHPRVPLRRGRRRRWCRSGAPRRQRRVNLGSGEEIAIRDLASLVDKATGYQAASYGTPASLPGNPAAGWTARARQGFGFDAHTPLREGLRRTVAYEGQARDESS